MYLFDQIGSHRCHDLAPSVFGAKRFAIHRARPREELIKGQDHRLRVAGGEYPGIGQFCCGKVGRMSGNAGKDGPPGRGIFEQL